MKVTWNIRYSSTYAYVDSVVMVSSNGKAYVLSQTNNSFRSLVVYKFLFDGKRVEITEYGLTSECDELDEEFLRLAKAVPPKDWRFWSEIYKMLYKEGKNKKEILDYMKTQAIARNLKL